MIRVHRGEKMKKIIAALTLLTCLVFGVGASAQTPLLTKGEGFTEPGVGTAFNLGSTFPTFHQVAWQPTTEPLVGCAFKVEKSLDGSNWSDLVSERDCTIPATVRAISGDIRFIRIEVTTLTSGRIVISYRGFNGATCGREYNGITSVIAGVDPAPGAELIVTVPADERWKILAAHFELVADSTVVDRNVFFSVDEAGNEYFRTLADGLVQSGQRGIYTASALGFVGTSGLGPSSVHQPVDVRTILIPVPSDIFIPGGHNIRTVTDGLQPGDDYGPATLLVESCPKN